MRQHVYLQLDAPGIQRWRTTAALLGPFRHLAIMKCATLPLFPCVFALLCENRNAAVQQP